MRCISLFCLALLFGSMRLYSQSCDDLIEYVKSEGRGSTYYSPTISSISKVTFYRAEIDDETNYFAIVCFKENKYSSNCTEYIYQVGRNTQFNYSLNYSDSAGEAFWDYIQPYSDVLGCSPNL